MMVCRYSVSMSIPRVAQRLTKNIYRVCCDFPRSVACASMRHVYLDMGVNWGDTLDLYKQELPGLLHQNASNWEIYGFEAAPLLQPYVDQLVQWKNGVPGVKHPVTCEPPVGSTHDKLRFAPVVGCWRSWAPKMNFCMDHAFRDAQQHDRPNMSLIDRSMVMQRLSTARHPLSTQASTSSTRAARYTFIPAAVGGKAGTLTFNRNRAKTYASSGSNFTGGSLRHIASGSGTNEPILVQIIGALALARCNLLHDRRLAPEHNRSSHSSDSSNANLCYIPLHMPPARADVASWMRSHFTKEDYVMVKMDIEGAEFDIVKKLAEDDALQLIDVLAIECHGWSGNCAELLNVTRDAGIRVRTDYEKYVPDSYWKASLQHFRDGLNSPACAHLNFTCGPKECTKGRSDPAE